MRRTEASWVALERDHWRCQWCFYKLNRIRPATDAHHIFGRARVDEPDAIIALCHDCHMAYHGAKITKCELIDLIERFIVHRNIRVKYREFHDCPD